VAAIRDRAWQKMDGGVVTALYGTDPATAVETLAEEEHADDILDLHGSDADRS
jgi:hypothetical protein